MTALLILAGYLAGALVSARLAAIFLRRGDERYGLNDDHPWDGGEWFIVFYTALVWPIGVPIGWLMTWPQRELPGRVQRLLSGRRSA